MGFGFSGVGLALPPGCPSWCWKWVYIWFTFLKLPVSGCLHIQKVSEVIIRPFLGLHLGLRFGFTSGFTFRVYVLGLRFGFTILGLRFWVSHLVPRDFPVLTILSYAPAFPMSKHPRTTICSYQLLTAYGQIVSHDYLPMRTSHILQFIHLSESF